MDEIRPASRLPADPAWWDALAERVSAAAAPELARGRRMREPWWAALADAAPWLAGGAVAAALAGWLFLPGLPPVTESGPGTLIARTLTPSDAIARTLLRESAPPIGSLMLPADTEEN